jgi:hypothetical protein
MRLDVHVAFASVLCVLFRYLITFSSRADRQEDLELVRRDFRVVGTDPRLKAAQWRPKASTASGQ